jgi:hypothetical protein
MAANNGYVYIGTDQGVYADQVAKTGYAVTKISYGSSAIPENVASITANQYGYVSINWGVPNNDSYVVFNPTAPGGGGSGGGAQTTLSTTIGIMPTPIGFGSH